MNDKKQVVIEENGMRFSFVIGKEHSSCCECPASRWCKDGTGVNNLCQSFDESGERSFEYHCTSATKIEDDGKVYGPHMYLEAKRFKDKKVEFYSHNEWKIDVLSSIRDGEAAPYLIGGSRWYSTIREIKTEKITMEEARERFNIPDNVLIERE